MTSSTEPISLTLQVQAGADTTPEEVDELARQLLAEVLGVTLGSLLSGVAVGFTLWRARSVAAPWQPLVIVAGWTLSAGASTLVNIVSDWSANQFWIGIIDGALGSVVMFWVLRQDRARSTSRKTSP